MIAFVLWQVNFDAFTSATIAPEGFESPVLYRMGHVSIMQSCRPP